MVVWPINAVHLFHVVHLPMVYRGRLLIGYHFEVLLKVLLRDHVDRGNELAVVVVGPIGKLGEFDIAASWWFMRERIAACQSDKRED